MRWLLLHCSGTHILIFYVDRTNVHEPMSSNDLILKIYDAAADSSLWPWVLERVSHECSAVGSIIFDVADDGENRTLSTSHISSGYDPELLESYLGRFHSQELAIQDRLAKHLSRNNDIDAFEQDLSSAAASEDRDPESVQWLAALGIREWYACFLDKDNISRSRFSLQLPSSDRKTVAKRNAAANLLLPHIAKALELGRPAIELRRQNLQLLAAMDQLRVGICVLSADRSVVARNKEFDRQIEGCGVFRILPDGRLGFNDPKVQDQIGALISDSAAHGKKGARPRLESIVTSREGDLEPLCLEIAPLETQSELGSSAVGGAIMYSLDTNLPVKLNAEAMSATYNLNGAELAIAGLIGEGGTNREIAEIRNRSIDTISVQVKSVLSKTASANRTQLLRLMSGYTSMLTDLS
ncbi:MAG: helix-turn-helix transcriptional regulator [Pseudomonadota bacterium]